MKWGPVICILVGVAAMTYGATITGPSTTMQIVGETDGSGEAYSALSEEEKDLFDQALSEHTEPFPDAVSASGEHFKGIEAVEYGGSTYTIVVEYGASITNHGILYSLAGMGLALLGAVTILWRHL